MMIINIIIMKIKMRLQRHDIVYCDPITARQEWDICYDLIWVMFASWRIIIT